LEKLRTVRQGLLDIGLDASDDAVQRLEAKIKAAEDVLPPSPPTPPKQRPHLEVQISRVTRLRDQQVRKLERTHELFEAVEAYVHSALRKVEEIQHRGNAQAARLRRLNTELHALTRQAPLIRPTFEGERGTRFNDTGSDLDDIEEDDDDDRRT
jgi:hypothetical protein